MLIAQDVLNVRGYKFDHSKNSQVMRILATMAKHDNKMTK